MPLYISTSANRLKIQSPIGSAAYLHCNMLAFSAVSVKIMHLDHLMLCGADLSAFYTVYTIMSRARRQRGDRLQHAHLSQFCQGLIRAAVEYPCSSILIPDPDIVVKIIDEYASPALAVVPLFFPQHDIHLYIFG